MVENLGSDVHLTLPQILEALANQEHPGTAAILYDLQRESQEALSSSCSSYCTKPWCPVTLQHRFLVPSKTRGFSAPERRSLHNQQPIT